MGYSVVCAVFGHRYLYELVASGGPAGPAWVCRRCHDHQATRPPGNGLPWPGIFGGWGGGSA